MEKSEGERSEEVEEQNQSQRKGQGKSCAGILYHYSAMTKSKNRNLCFGYRRSISLEKSLYVPTAEDGFTLSGCYTGCLGHSVYRIRDESSPDNKHDEVELPDCRGFEVIHCFYEEDVHPPARRTGDDTEDDFLTRFERNAYIVAKGVAKNMCTVGTYIKEIIDDILSPKGPK